VTPRRPDIVFFPAPEMSITVDRVYSKSFEPASVDALDVYLEVAVRAAPDPRAVFLGQLFGSMDESLWEAIDPPLECSAMSQSCARVPVRGWSFVRAELLVPPGAEFIPWMVGFASASSEAA
jgi:hypothetical protein